MFSPAQRMKAPEKHILETVHQLSDEIIDFTSRLVEEPSTLGNEASALRVMEHQLTSLGFSPVRVPVDASELQKHPGYAPVPWSYEGRYNVVAIREGEGEGGKSALFNGHLDVVSPEPVSVWDSGPFTPAVKDGWLYGRGAGDMKSGVAAMTYAVHAVERAGFGLKAPVTVEAVIEEECSGNGALACMAAGYDADAVLIPEPFGPAILTNQVGVLWFRVAVQGRSTHVLDTSAGANAIEKCITLIDALKALELELNEENVPAPYEGVKHPLNLNIGVIHGGDWPSNVPGAAEFRARLSFFPGMSYEEIKARVSDTVKQQAQNDPWMKEYPPQIDFYGFRSEGYSVTISQPALASLNDCHKAVTGEDAAEYIATCTTDLRVFHFYGRGEATCYGPVAENIHGANERVNVDSIIHTAKVYALFLGRWCGLME